MAASRIVTLCTLLSGLGPLSGCETKLEAPNGTCAVTPLLDCSMTATDAGINTLENAAPLVPYACSGTARPDDSPAIVEGVPRGRICADRGLLGDSGQRGYCCTDYDTTCAYNPVADCKEPRNGFECRGSVRPEMYNASIFCDQAIRSGELVDYCCADTRLQWGCSGGALGGKCPTSLVSWTCTSGNLPRTQELADSKSRPDNYYTFCGSPLVNGDQSLTYCCFTPGLLPEGSSCYQHTSVPGCASDFSDPKNLVIKFGVACLGPDLPGDSFPALSCPETGVPGMSMEGYPATLYCCDHRALIK